MYLSVSFDFQHQWMSLWFLWLRKTCSHRFLDWMDLQGHIKVINYLKNSFIFDAFLHFIVDIILFCKNKPNKKNNTK